MPIRLGKPLPRKWDPEYIMRLLERRIEVEPPAASGLTTPCWIYTGFVNGHGYGMLWFDGKKRFVHRIAFTVFKTRIRPGYDIDHRCRNTRCFNPDHLRQRDALANRADNRGKFTSADCVAPF